MEEILDAINKIDKAFVAGKVTKKEVFLALPVIIIEIFKDVHAEKDIGEQKEFFKRLEDAVYELLDED